MFLLRVYVLSFVLTWTSVPAGRVQKSQPLWDHCPFNSGLCNWRNVDDVDTFNWTLHSGCTPSNYTGPNCHRGHTKITLTGNVLYVIPLVAPGNYLYLEASYPRLPGDVARLRYHNTGSYFGCMEFIYHMSGEDIGWLKVYHVTDGGLETLLWGVTGDQGDVWKLVLIDLLDSDDGLPSQIFIEGGIGNGYRGDIAIDDVMLSKGSCRNEGEGFPLKQIAYWRLDGTDANITLEGNTTFEVHEGWHAAYLDGFTSPLVLPIPDLSNVSFSVALWVLTRSPDHEGSILTSHDQLEINLASERIVVQMRNREGLLVANLTSSSALEPNTWTHVAVTWNEKDRITSLIMNDTKEIQQTVHDLLLFAQHFYIGKSVGNSRFQGYIRDVKLFERVLTDAEIAEIRGPVCQPQCQAPGFCDRDTGKCFCGDLKLVTEWCTNAFVDTIYKESVQYFADTEEDLKSDGHFIPYDSDNKNSLTFVDGPVNKAIQLYARYRFKLVTPFCFDRPSVCTEGLSMALWVKYPGHTISSTFFLRPALNKIIARSHYNNHEGFGVRAVIQDRRQGVVEAFVTSKTHRCSYSFTIPTQAWYHAVIVWSHPGNIKVFVNGHRLQPHNNCTKPNRQLLVDRKAVFIGTNRGRIGIDELAIWHRALSNDEAEGIFWETARATPKKVKLKVRLTNETWQERLRDLESEIYHRFVDHMSKQFSTFFERNHYFTGVNINNFSAGSVVVNLELTFSQLSYEDILRLEEALKINKSLGNVAMESLETSFVNVPNKSPQVISAHARDNSSINVTWTGLREEDFQGASQGYKVLYKKTDSAVNYDVLTEYGPSYTTVIQNLLPGTWYTIRVLAFNVHGDGVPSEPVNVTTAVNHLNVTGHNLTWSKIQVYWNPVPLDIQGYNVRYWAQKNGEESASVMNTSKTVHSLSIDFLEPFTVYVVEVKAMLIGQDNIKGQTRVSTDEHVPWAPPTITSVFNTSSTSIKIQWRPIPDDLANGILLGYKVVYQAFLPGSSQNFTWTNASTTSVELQGLEKFTLYLVGVSGYTRKGAGGVQFTHLSTGEDAASRPPNNVTVQSNGTGLINVEWKPVDEKFLHGILRGYKVRYREHAQAALTNWTVQTITHDTLRTELVNLKPGTMYGVQVSAFTIKDGVWSETLMAKTPLGHLLHPQNVTAQPISPTSVLVSWSPALTASVNVSLQYVVQWEQIANGVKKNITVSDSPHTIEGLNALTNYTVCVATEYQGVITECSDEVSVQTLREHHLNVTGHNVSACSFQVLWSPVPLGIQGYMVKYWGEKENKESASARIVCNTTQSLLIDSLKPSTSYVVQVTAFRSGQVVRGQVNISTEERDSCFSVSLEYKLNVTGHNVSGSEIQVYWNPVPLDIQGYRVKYWALTDGEDAEGIRNVSNTTHSLLIDRLKPSTVYTVQVTALLTRQVIRGEANISTDKSDYKLNVTGHNVSESKIQVFWNPLSLDLIHGYSVRYWALEGDWVSTAVKNVSKTTHSLLIDRLRPSTVYVVQVTALLTGQIIRGEANISTDAEPAPCDSPNQLTTRDITATSAILDWVYDGACAAVGLVTGYRLTYTSHGIPTELDIPDVQTTETQLDQLTPETTYRVEVLALTSDGKNSPPSDWVEFTTGHDSASDLTPNNLHAVLVLSDAISLRWSLPENDEAEVHQNDYTVMYRPVNGGAERHVTIEGYGKRSCFLSGLRPKTTYQLRVKASGAHEDGPVSPSINVTTLDSVPSAPPSNITIMASTSTNQLPVQWKKIPETEANGIITGYLVKYQAVMVGGKSVEDEPVREKIVDADTYSVTLDDVQSFTTYDIRIAGVTKRGEGVYSKQMVQETCHCEKRLSTNYWLNPPYVISSSTNQNISGIFMDVLDKMVPQCCGDCYNGHGKSVIDYNLDGRNNSARKDTKQDLNEAIDHRNDLTFPVHGYTDQRTYLGSYKYVPVVETPGAAFIVKHDRLKAPITNALFTSWPLAIVILVFLLLFGFLFWMMDCAENPEEIPPTFLKGFWEAMWWGFITAATVGYGDRTPRSFLAKGLAMMWMLTGAVLFNLLTSYLSTGLTVLTVQDNFKLYGMEVAALHDSPEYYLAVRRNAQVNKVRNYTRLEDIRDDLLSGVVKGALVDTYVAAARQYIFDHESLAVHKLIDYQSSFGIVLGGNSVRLQHCFLDYLKQERSFLTSLIDNYTETLQPSTASRAEQEATGLFDSSDDIYKVNVIVLSVILTAAVLSGVVYELCRRRMNREVEDKEISLMLTRKEELILEMRVLLAEFYSNMNRQYIKLSARHGQERKVVLDTVMKEIKSLPPQERRKRANLQKEEQKSWECKDNKLYLDDTS